MMGGGGGFGGGGGGGGYQGLGHGEEDAVIRMRGLPFSAQESDILTFFTGFPAGLSYTLQGGGSLVGFYRAYATAAWWGSEVPFLGSIGRGQRAQKRFSPIAKSS